MKITGKKCTRKQNFFYYMHEKEIAKNFTSRHGMPYAMKLTDLTCMDYFNINFFLLVCRETCTNWIYDVIPDTFTYVSLHLVDVFLVVTNEVLTCKVFPIYN